MSRLPPPEVTEWKEARRGRDDSVESLRGAWWRRAQSLRQRCTPQSPLPAGRRSPPLRSRTPRSEIGD